MSNMSHPIQSFWGANYTQLFDIQFRLDLAEDFFQQVFFSYGKSFINFSQFELAQMKNGKQIQQHGLSISACQLSSC